MNRLIRSTFAAILILLLLLTTKITKAASLFSYDLQTSSISRHEQESFELSSTKMLIFKAQALRAYAIECEQTPSNTKLLYGPYVSGAEGILLSERSNFQNNVAQLVVSYPSRWIALASDKPVHECRLTRISKKIPTTEKIAQIQRCYESPKRLEELLIRSGYKISYLPQHGKTPQQSVHPYELTAAERAYVATAILMPQPSATDTYPQTEDLNLLNLGILADPRPSEKFELHKRGLFLVEFYPLILPDHAYTQQVCMSVYSKGTKIDTMCAPSTPLEDSQTSTPDNPTFIRTSSGIVGSALKMTIVTSHPVELRSLQGMGYFSVRLIEPKWRILAKRPYINGVLVITPNYELTTYKMETYSGRSKIFAQLIENSWLLAHNQQLRTSALFHMKQNTKWKSLKRVEQSFMEHRDILYPIHRPNAPNTLRETNDPVLIPLAKHDNTTLMPVNNRIEAIVQKAIPSNEAALCKLSIGGKRFELYVLADPVRIRFHAPKETTIRNLSNSCLLWVRRPINSLSLQERRFASAIRRFWMLSGKQSSVRLQIPGPTMAGVLKIYMFPANGNQGKAAAKIEFASADGATTRSINLYHVPTVQNHLQIPPSTIIDLHASETYATITNLSNQAILVAGSVRYDKIESDEYLPEEVFEILAKIAALENDATIFDRIAKSNELLERLVSSKHPQEEELFDALVEHSIYMAAIGKLAYASSILSFASQFAHTTRSLHTLWAIDYALNEMMQQIRISSKDEPSPLGMLPLPMPQESNSYEASCKERSTSAFADMWNILKQMESNPETSIYACRVYAYSVAVQHEDWLSAARALRGLGDPETLNFRLRALIRAYLAGAMLDSRTTTEAASDAYRLYLQRGSLVRHIVVPILSWSSWASISNISGNLRRAQSFKPRQIPEWSLRAEKKLIKAIWGRYWEDEYYILLDGSKRKAVRLAINKPITISAEVLFKQRIQNDATYGSCFVEISYNNRQAKVYAPQSPLNKTPQSSPNITVAPSNTSNMVQVYLSLSCDADNPAPTRAKVRIHASRELPASKYEPSHPALPWLIQLRPKQWWNVEANSTIQTTLPKYSLIRLLYSAPKNLAPTLSCNGNILEEANESQDSSPVKDSTFLTPYDSPCTIKLKTKTMLNFMMLRRVGKTMRLTQERNRLQMEFQMESAPIGEKGLEGLRLLFTEAPKATGGGTLRMGAFTSMNGMQFERNTGAYRVFVYGPDTNWIYCHENVCINPGASIRFRMQGYPASFVYGKAGYSFDWGLALKSYLFGILQPVGTKLEGSFKIDLQATQRIEILPYIHLSPSLRFVYRGFTLGKIEPNQDPNEVDELIFNEYTFHHYQGMIPSVMLTMRPAWEWLITLKISETTNTDFNLISPDKIDLNLISYIGLKNLVIGPQISYSHRFEDDYRIHAIDRIYIGGVLRWAWWISKRWGVMLDVSGGYVSDLNNASIGIRLWGLYNIGNTPPTKSGKFWWPLMNFVYYDAYQPLLQQNLLWEQ